MAKFLYFCIMFSGWMYSSISCLLLMDESEFDNSNNTIENVGNIPIDLSHFGERIFGLPSKETGSRVAAWNSTDQVNPEEMGEYLEGDILHPPDLTKSGMIRETYRWPNGVVPYIITGTFSLIEKKMIMDAFTEYHSQTCIKFVRRTTQKDYILIKNAKSGCWSSVGRIGGPQQLNLQTPGCVSLKGTVIHELMHALGFIHEQSRPERDNFVTIKYENIQSGKSYNFDKSSAIEVDSFGVSYDYGSVMHYSAYAFSANNKPTIVPKRFGAQLGQRAGLGKNDVKSINAMYKCKWGLLQMLWGLVTKIFG